MNTIFVRELRVESRIGVYAWEQRLAQSLLRTQRGGRVGDVDRAAAPRMADRAVDQGVLRIDAQDPEVGGVVGPVADQVTDRDMLKLRQ